MTRVEFSADLPAHTATTSPAAFWAPVWTSSSPDAEHVPFVFWAIDAVRPRWFVDLSLGSGDIYMAALQAIGALSLPARAVAVAPTLQHVSAPSGEPGLSAFHDHRYAAFSNLTGSRPAALSLLDGAEVDMLHLDAAEADVRVDDISVLEAALRHTGVILVSNYNSASQGIRTWLKPHQSFDFRHGGGLRVAAIGLQPPSAITALLESERDGSGASGVRTYYARLGKALKDETAYIEAVAAMRRLEGSIAQKSAHLTLARQDAEALRREAAAREAEFDRCKNALDGHAAEVERLHSLLGERDSELRRLAELIDVHEAEQVRLAAELTARELERVRQDAEAANARMRHQSEGEDLARSNAERGRLERVLAERNAEQTRLEHELTERLAEQDRLEKLLNNWAVERTGQDQARERLERRIAEQAAEVERLTAALGSADLKAQTLDLALAAALTRSEQARQDSVSVRTEALASLQAERVRSQVALEAMQRDLVEASHFRRTLEQRAASLSRDLQAIQASTSWRITGAARSLLARAPVLAVSARRTAKLLWWTGSLQLIRRLHARRLALRAAIAPEREKAAEITGPRLRAEVAPEPVLHRDQVMPGLLDINRRLDAVQRQTTWITSVVELERGRLDYALATQEQVVTRIDEFHRVRSTEEYRQAFESKAPLVTVCIATMNRSELLIERCLRSVLNQSYGNLQIVVVGDHCTDDTEYQLAKLRDDRITFLNLPERGPYPQPGKDRWRVAGTYAANAAIGLSEGLFLTHLDDDDSFVPDRLEILVRAAQQHQADFIWHPFWSEGGDGRWVSIGDGSFTLGQITTSAVFYHRWLGQFGWDVSAYRVGEPGDWNRFRKIKALRPDTHFVDQPLTYHYSEGAQANFIPQAGERFVA